MVTYVNSVGDGQWGGRLKRSVYSERYHFLWRRLTCCADGRVGVVLFYESRTACCFQTTKSAVAIEISK